ncbi:hypothetical protein NKJ26_03410 [Mesorhizobium sp. M0152]|uniref:hypothetical protein n=1 Tax=Mesorhizobium sp. M0152 TaxID=2956898 RepID=UPI0033361046
MTGARLKIRLAYQRGFQVVDGSTILNTFPTKEEAFQFLVDRDARVWLDWGRTVIGGRTAPFDYAASFLQESVGRIRQEQHPPSAGIWLWSCFENGARGKTEIKDEAVFQVERAFTRFVVKADWR